MVGREHQRSQDVSATKAALAEELREIDAGRIAAPINGANGIEARNTAHRGCR
jgi:hypothetical protein